VTDEAHTLWQRLYYTRLLDALRGRFDASLDWRRQVAEASLPSEVASLIATVVHRTKLWRSEQVNVACELISHFRDGLEAGRTPAQLIESFGDPQQAARLIRRAKKRGRSIFWHLWQYGWITLAMLVTFYVTAGLYLVLGRPSIRTDYLAVINQRAVSVPEDQRAWPFYRTALGQMLEKGFFPKWAGNSELSPKDAEWNDAINWLNEHQTALESIRGADQRRDFGFPLRSRAEAFDPEDRKVLNELGDLEAQTTTQPDEPLESRDLYSTLIPQLQTLRSISKLLMIDARRAAQAGDGDTTLADVTAILGVSRHVQETPLLVATLMAAVIQKIACATIQEALTDHADLWTVDQLRNLAHSVAESQIDWQRGMDGERTAFCDVLQRVYTDDGNGDGRITADGLRRIQQQYATNGNADEITGIKPLRMRFGDAAMEVIAPASLFVMASRGEVLARYDELMAQQKSEWNKPFWELSRVTWDSPVASWSQSEKRRYLPLTLLREPNIRIAIEAQAGVKDGVLIGIALECYRRANAGNWPESLDQLVPGYLPRLPVDRITGGPLHYKIVNVRPLVYSVGADRDDDGGRAPVGEDGQTNEDLASVYFWDGKPNADPAHDGDWIIWSAVPHEKSRPVPQPE
jgi:hypothetical protein